MMVRKMAKWGMWAAVVAAAVTGSSVRAADPGSAEQAVRDVMNGLADGKLVVLWQALPASYQKDVKALIKDSADTVDPDVYDKGWAVTRKATKLLKDKKDFILNGEFAKQIPPNLDKKKLAEGYDAVVGIVDTLANSELSKLDEVKKADVEKFLTGTTTKLGTQVNSLVSLVESVNPDPNIKKMHEAFANLKKAKITVVKSGSTETTLKVEVPGETKPAEEEVFVKVDGKWLPKKMVDDWAKDIKEAKEKTKMAQPFLSKEGKEQALAVLGQAEKVIDQLQNTKTEKEFTEAVKGIVGSFVGGK